MTFATCAHCDHDHITSQDQCPVPGCDCTDWDR